MTNYENLINLPLNFNANNHHANSNSENNAKIAVAGEQLLNKMSQRDFSEVSGKGYRNTHHYLAFGSSWKPYRDPCAEYTPFSLCRSTRTNMFWPCTYVHVSSLQFKHHDNYLWPSNICT
uniref:GA23450 n=1 Tax=Drosophila pseudoobscura bogotana TaxID=46244 RepID=B7TZ79_DROPB|nr:GA23450 [Drosophila pseudoobscura bogotana]